MRSKDYKYSICGLVLIGLLFCAGESEASSCKGLYFQKRYLAAGRCFAKQAQALRRTKGQDAKIRRGRSIKNAARSYNKAAKHQKRLAHRAYYHALAASLLQRYIKQKLAISAYRIKSAKRLWRRYTNAVGWGRIRVQPRHKSAKVVLKGYRYKRRSKGRLDSRLRPGTYQLIVYYQDGSVIRRRFRLLPGQSMRLVLQNAPQSPTPPKKRAPVIRDTGLSGIPITDPLTPGPDTTTRTKPPQTRSHSQARDRTRTSAPSKPAPPKGTYNKPKRSPARLSKAVVKRPQPIQRQGIHAGTVALWGGFLGGAITAVIGGILLGQAGQQNTANLNQFDQLRKGQQSTSARDTQALAADIRQAELLHGFGWGALVIGIAATTTCGIWLLFQRLNNPTDLPLAPPTASNENLGRQP